MFKALSLAPLCLVTLALLAVGCKSSSESDHSGMHHDHSAMSSGMAMHSPDPAVMCDQCGAMWVRSQATNDKGVNVPFAYTWKKADVCPDCEKAAQGYFANGTLAECKMCGNQLQVVKPKM